MTPEQRLDRLERLALLYVKAGRRFRRDSREQRERINILIDFQHESVTLFNRNEEQFSRNEERFVRHEGRLDRIEELAAQNEERAAWNEEQLTRLIAENEIRFAHVAESQRHTDQQLRDFISSIRANQKRSES